MNAFVSELVQQQNEAIDRRPRFAAVMSDKWERIRFPGLMEMHDKRYRVFAHGWQQRDEWDAGPEFTCSTRAEADAAMQGYVFCGADFVTVHYYAANMRSETTEFWKAAS